MIMTDQEADELRQEMYSLRMVHENSLRDAQDAFREFKGLEGDIKKVLADNIALLLERRRLREKLAVAKNTLDRISDPITSSLGRPSFADWELRQMAREALAKIGGDDDT